MLPGLTGALNRAAALEQAGRGDSVTRVENNTLSNEQQYKNKLFLCPLTTADQPLPRPWVSFQWPYSPVQFASHICVFLNLRDKVIDQNCLEDSS